MRGLAARTVRPEPLGPNRSSSAERPRDPPSPPAVCSCGTVRPVHLALLERKRGGNPKEGARESAKKRGRAAMKLGAGSSGPVRPEPLGPNRSSSAERPRDLPPPTPPRGASHPPPTYSFHSHPRPRQGPGPEGAAGRPRPPCDDPHICVTRHIMFRSKQLVNRV